MANLLALPIWPLKLRTMSDREVIDFGKAARERCKDRQNEQCWIELRLAREEWPRPTSAAPQSLRQAARIAASAVPRNVIHLAVNATALLSVTGVGNAPGNCRIRRGRDDYRNAAEGSGSQVCDAAAIQGQSYVDIRRHVDHFGRRARHPVHAVR